MVPNISPNGRSFRGAGAYHLHDRPAPDHPRPRSASRILFTATRNLANDEPHAALDEMWRTAEDAAHLKASSGAAQRGRRNLAPVKTISLAWAPGQTPSRQDMTAAADAFLHAMGWGQHQAVYVAHGDTAHPHLHIILNRVHPSTGRTLNDWQERKRAQAWALAYERQQGAVLCTARIARRACSSAAPAGLPHAQAKLLSGLAPDRRRQIAPGHRARFRAPWARLLNRHKARLAELALERRALDRSLPSLLREADFSRAGQGLAHLHRRQAEATRRQASQRAALRLQQYTSLANRLRRAGFAPANDNAIAVLRRAHAARQSPGFRAPHRASPQAAAVDLRGLAALQQHERKQLIAMQAAARALARRHHALAGDAASLARSEIVISFAARWAALRRLPAEQRTAAAAALQAEQAAALSARLSHHLGRLRAHLRSARLALSSDHTQARRTLAQRHKLAWAAAASAVSRPRPARGPPLRPSASSTSPHAAHPW